MKIVELCIVIQLLLFAVPSTFCADTAKKDNVEFAYRLSAFSTKVDQNEYRRNLNIIIGSSKIDGVVIKPGDVFSLNAVMGDRTDKEGYVNAPVLTELGRVQGIAGGVCQLAGTIYNAALLSGLEIVERHHHKTPVRYLRPGRDATVTRDLDLKFKNIYEFPIAVYIELKDTKLICEIRGAEEVNQTVSVRVEYDVTVDGGVFARSFRLIEYPDGSAQKELLFEDEYEPM